MFTGIVSEMGKVVAFYVEHNTAVLGVCALKILEDLELGASVAVNGVCLTVCEIREGNIFFDIMGETLERSSLGSLEIGDFVNLERCVVVGQRLDGHIVQGHVDGLAVLVERESLDNWCRLRFELDNSFLLQYVVVKGSVALDGVALTVTAVSDFSVPKAWFEVCLIPFTLEHTVLGKRLIGDFVNVEVDILAKHVQSLLAFAAGRG